MKNHHFNSLREFSLVFTVIVQLLMVNHVFGQSKGKEPALQAYSFSKTPVWADEFTYTGKPDTTKWGYDLGGHGWGNNEKQYYTKGDNAEVADGFLTITARKEKREGSEYTSTRMVSKNKGDFLYGRFEARIKVPAGLGTWPAFWMLPTDKAYGEWPNSGEIDIMEHVGYMPNLVHISTHCKAYYFKINTQKTDTLRVPTAQTAFHNYRVDWTPKYIRGFVDDKQIFQVLNEGKTFAEWPFDKRFHLLLNLAIGGDWGGVKGIDDTIFPSQLVFDYVRVYQLMP